MSIWKNVGGLAACSGVAAGVALAAPAVAFADDNHSIDPEAHLPMTGQDSDSPVDTLGGPGDSGLTGHSGLPVAGPDFALPRAHDGWFELGDSRPSATEAQARRSGEESPPPKRADVGPIPRLGAGAKPENAELRWSYDFKNVVDTGTVTQHVPVPYPPIAAAVPGNLGVVDNQAGHLDEDNRTAEGPRRDTKVSEPGWNLTTTDVNVPGAGRVYRFDMVCPGHEGTENAHQHGKHAKHVKSSERSQEDQVYTGWSDFNLREGHQVFSYHWGDPAFNDGFILAHYLAYGLANSPPEDGGAGAKKDSGPDKESGKKKDSGGNKHSGGYKH